MKIRAIKECPNQLPGSVFDVPDALAVIFIDLKIAEPYTEPDPEPASKRRGYRRRDLVAQG